MKISNHVKRMTSTGTVATGTRARISRVLLTQLIASTALVAPFAVGPAFAQTVTITNPATGFNPGNNATNTVTLGPITGATLQTPVIQGGSSNNQSVNGANINTSLFTGGEVRSTQITGTTTINISGNINARGGQSFSGGLNNNGTSTLNGATTINNTLDVNAGGTAVDVNAEGLNVVVSCPATTDVALAACAPASSVSVTQSSVSLLQGGANGITSSGGNTVVTGANSSQIKGGGNSVTVNSSGVNLAGSGGAALQLTGVADGTAPDSAVNRRQLDNLETEMSGGIASAMAMSQLPDPVPGSNYSVGLGAGFYNGESAFALGGAMYLENGVSLKAAYTYSSEGESGFGLGAGYSW